MVSRQDVRSFLQAVRGSFYSAGRPRTKQLRNYDVREKKKILDSLSSLVVAHIEWKKLGLENKKTFNQQTN